MGFELIKPDPNLAHKLKTWTLSSYLLIYGNYQCATVMGPGYK